MKWLDLEGPLRSPRAWAQLLAGLLGYAVSVALMIRSELGLGPWDALHVGLSKQLGISVGMAGIGMGFLIVLGSTAIGMRPGVGTIANMVLIGAFLDAILPWTPAAPNLAWALAYHAGGIVLCGLATGFYIAARLGKGPRDGLMLAVADRTRWPVRRVRTLIELSALGAGWAMGGTVGVGTILFALGIGPAVQWGIGLFHAHDPPCTIEP